MRNRHLLFVALLIASSARAAGPILFVTQVPIADGDDVAKMTLTSTFANHLPTTQAAPRGGDLMLRAANGTLRNLTQEAGFGAPAGFQGANAIAVRDPNVAFDGSKAIFSMVVGAPTVAGGAENYVWQLYEVTNLASAGPATIVKVPNQPANFNNFGGNYLSDGSIVFVSDRPRDGSAHLYPLYDEYRAQPGNSGLWRLDPASGDLKLLEHTPSGSFAPIVDSFGRVVFTRWDHLMRDGNNTASSLQPVFDFLTEAAGAPTASALDVFPEPIQSVAGSNVNGFEINQFMPWTINQDGTGEEFLNHLGRHELGFGANRTFSNDANLVVFNYQTSGRPNQNPIANFFQLREDPLVPGRYVGVDAGEFGSHGGGQIVAISAPPTTNPNVVTVQYINHRATALTLSNPNNFGHFRDPLPMSDGTLIAAFANTPGPEASSGSANAPISNYSYRLYPLVPSGSLYVNGPSALTGGGISKTVSYFIAGNAQPVVHTNVTLWELQPVEVIARPVPPVTAAAALAAPEVAAFAQAQVDANELRAWLRARGLALVNIRNVTSRDAADRQQPFNLRIAGGGTQTLGAGGAIYDLSEFQVYQADQVRGLGTPAAQLPGRRSLAQPFHDTGATPFNLPGASSPGAQPIAADGSVAMFVPAQRALTWQSLSAGGTLPAGSPVVRERYWIEFQPGEIRSCDGCHGANQLNQAGQPAPTNTSMALVQLLTRWRTTAGDVFKNGFE